MTPEQKIKQLILTRAVADGNLEHSGEITADNLAELYDLLCEDDMQWDYISDIRSGEVETGIPCQRSRHYESKSVAKKMTDGSWIGWTYWYGGGKHGEPEAVDWMGEAYEVNMSEEEKMVTVRTFTRINADS